MSVIFQILLAYVYRVVVCQLLHLLLVRCTHSPKAVICSSWIISAAEKKAL